MNIRMIWTLLALTVMLSSVQAGLVAYWPMEEGTGLMTTAGSCSPVEANGTLSDNVLWITSNLAPVPGGTSAALDFEANGVAGDFTGIVETQFPGISGAAARTVSAWIKADVTQNESAVILSYGTNANGERFSFRLNGTGVLRLEVQGGYAIATSLVNDGMWHHVAVTLGENADVNQSLFYLDGELDPVAGSGSRIINTGTTYPVSIGGSLHGASYNFDGVIDEVMIFDYVLSQNEIKTLCKGRNAHNVNPSNCQQDIALDYILSWSVGLDPNSGQVYNAINGHDIYLGEDEAAVRLATPADTSGIYRGMQSVGDENYDPGQDGGLELLSDRTYYLRIDERLNNGTVITGLVSSFDTIKYKPDIITQPVDVASFMNESVAFSLATKESPLTTEYQWYFGLSGETTNPVGENADTLEITVDSLDKEGYYWCRLTNTAGSVDSNAAYLTIKRQIGHWKFEDNLNNEIVGGGDGFLALDTLPLAIDPNYMEGIDGQALELTGNGHIVQIADSINQYNFYPRGLTVGAWCKTVQSGWGALVGKQLRSVTPWAGFLLNKNNGNPIFNIRQHTTQPLVTSPAYIADNQWHLMVGTYDHQTGGGRIYVDGVLSLEILDQFNLVDTNDQPLVFGRESADTGEYYVGLLDDIQIWNYSLDALTVANYYYEITGKSVCVELPENDFNNDCVVNLEDFAELTAVWLNCNLAPQSACFN